MRSMTTFRTRSKAKARGFTIIEIVVVLAILGALTSVVIPLGETVIRARQERELRQALWEIRTAIDAFKKISDQAAVQNTGPETGYPPTLAALAAGIKDPRQKTQILYFLRRIPRDPFSDSSTPAEKSWLLRSYASPPDQPAAGDDVFDIRSSSNASALDGSRYSSW